MCKLLSLEFRFNLKLDLFTLLMETCYYYSTYKIANTIFETMFRYGCVPDKRIKQLHFDKKARDVKEQV